MANLVLFDYSNLAYRCVTSKAGLTGWKDRAFQEMYDFVLEVAANYEAPVTDVVIALDSVTGYWRRDLFPPYKADRKRKRDESVDWDEVFRQFNEFSECIAEHLPWAVLRVDKCEADDVIYALSIANATDGGENFIYSSDSDYLMLCDEHTHIYNPLRGEWAAFPYDCKVNGKDFRYESPTEYKMYAILTGQAGKDNVYNIKTPTEFEGPRKPGFGVSAAAKLLAESEDCGLYQALQDSGWYDNYKRNCLLINPDALPTEYSDLIMEKYAAEIPKIADVRGFLTSIGSRLNADEVEGVLRALINMEQPVEDAFGEGESAADFQF